MRNRIRTLRKKRGLSLAQLGAMTATPPQTIWNIERGVSRNPGYQLVTRLAGALGVTVDELFSAPKQNEAA